MKAPFWSIKSAPPRPGATRRRNCPKRSECSSFRCIPVFRHVTVFVAKLRRTVSVLKNRIFTFRIVMEITRKIRVRGCITAQVINQRSPIWAHHCWASPAKHYLISAGPAGSPGFHSSLQHRTSSMKLLKSRKHKNCCLILHRRTFPDRFIKLRAPDHI